MREIEKKVFAKIRVVLERKEQYSLITLFNYERNRKKSFCQDNDSPGKKRAIFINYIV